MSEQEQQEQDWVGALVISRRRGESVLIGDNIRLTVTEIATGKVRLCFQAPRSVRIMRTELLTDEEGHGGD